MRVAVLGEEHEARRHLERDAGPCLVPDRVVRVAVLVAELRGRPRRHGGVEERHAARDVRLEPPPGRVRRLHERQAQQHIERDRDDVDVDAPGGAAWASVARARRHAAVDVKLLRADGRPEYGCVDRQAEEGRRVEIAAKASAYDPRLVELGVAVDAEPGRAVHGDVVAQGEGAAGVGVGEPLRRRRRRRRQHQAHHDRGDQGAHRWLARLSRPARWSRRDPRPSCGACRAAGSRRSGARGASSGGCPT